MQREKTLAIDNGDWIPREEEYEEGGGASRGGRIGALLGRLLLTGQGRKAKPIILQELGVKK